MAESTASAPACSALGARPALHHLPSQVRFWVTAGLVLTLDLWSKQWAFRSLRPDEVRSFIPSAIVFRRSLNDGAVFGSFTGQVSLFIIASLCALAFVFYLFAKSSRTQRSLHVAMAMILAGALGNLYDRSAIKADIVAFETTSGRPQRTIGALVEQTDEIIRIGDWPEGTNPRTFERSEVGLRQQGVVRDFIKFVFKFPSWVPRVGGRDVWPWVFNVADAALVCGMIVALFFGSRPERRAGKAS